MESTEFFTTEERRERRRTEALVAAQTDEPRFAPVLRQPGIDDPSHALPENRYVEVDQQADGKLFQSEVCEQLGNVNAGKCRDALYFHDDRVVDKQIQEVRRTKFESAVHERHGYVSRYPQTGIPKFQCEAGHVCGLQQSWPNLFVHANGAPDDGPSELVRSEWVGQHPAADRKQSATPILAKG